MDRRRFLEQSAAYVLVRAKPWPGRLEAQEAPIEQGASTPLPIPEPHFPDRLHLFIWRNWELANIDRLARVLETTPESILEIGNSMGLPKKVELSDDYLQRIYITVIRQNWHILPDDQLMELLGWDVQEYEYHLKEDDFLWVKLGMLKPKCDRLRYSPPSPLARERAAEIREIVRETMGAAIDEAGEPAFTFIKRLSDTRTTSLRDPSSKAFENEIDLSTGWILLSPTPSSRFLLDLVQDFRMYLAAAMDSELRSGGAVGSVQKLIRIEADSSISHASGSFEISTSPNEIRVLGQDAQGVREAFSYLKDQMEARGGPYLARGTVRRSTRLDPRYVYSYFALYGDPLMDEKNNPFPDGLLDKLSRSGVNGVWLQAVLRNLAPSTIFPEFGKGSEIRLRNLRKLVDRAALHGVKIYLYLNEPRSMPADFFTRHLRVRGTHDPGDTRFFAMCTSTTEVREWLSESLAYVFSQAPGLGGIFCITASENLTNCVSHGHSEFCPRCSKLDGSNVIAQLIRTFRTGVRRKSASADIIAWDWGWGKNWIRNGANPSNVIPQLPEDVALLSVSEWAKQIDRGGHPAQVGEYSISVVGPGPRALQNWEIARRSRLKRLAKVQWSCTWEISAVPYIPVPGLIVQHCENLVKPGVEGLMASWTVGGYPSPNFEVAKRYYFSPLPFSSEEVLREVALRRYGKDAASQILDAWKAFGEAFVQYPMEGGNVVYHVPTQHGPANLLRLQPTGYKAGMMLFPYDDYEHWVGSYPVRIAEDQFQKLAVMWKKGLETFLKALNRVPRQKLSAAQIDLGIAETCYLHFQSVANQIRFYRLREEYLSAHGAAQRELGRQMAQIAENEIQLSVRQYHNARRDSCIGYEASNQYYYRPLDLVEKVLNCHYVQTRITAEIDRQV
ncbi:MAG: hypothetical protein EPN47_15960 [Acidobacteria bacterium]|nr:MAG: hypothetical protein EPN47_15960 [Acidobacteriota bacterium]